MYNNCSPTCSLTPPPALLSREGADALALHPASTPQDCNHAVNADADDLMMVVVEEEHAADADKVAEHVAVPAAVKRFVVGTADAVVAVGDLRHRHTVLLEGRMRGATGRAKM